MIDNFKQISKLLTFNSEDEFYFVQILQRKKDGHKVRGSNNSSRLVRAYYITSVEQLEELQEEMMALANFFDARVGINLNKRSFEKTAFNTMKKIAEQMHNRDYYNVRKAYNSACGIHNAMDDKLWILDIDRHPGKISMKDFKFKKDMIRFINSQLQPEGIKIIADIPSKNGCHLISKPFNTYNFKKFYPDIEIHKNNPTNLYCP